MKYTKKRLVTLEKAVGEKQFEVIQIMDIFPGSKRWEVFRMYKGLETKRATGNWNMRRGSD